MSMSFFIYTDENFQGQLGESVFSQSCTECKNWTFFCEVCVYVFFLLLIVLISLIFWWNYLDHNRENRVGNYFYDYVVSSHKEAASFYTYHFELIFIDPNVIHYNSLPPFYIGTISPFIHWTPHHRESLAFSILSIQRSTHRLLPCCYMPRFARGPPHCLPNYHLNLDFLF